MDTDDLRHLYVGVSCYVRGGTRAETKLGAGSRILYIVACDGQEVVAFDSVGRKRRFQLRDVNLTAVYDESGETCRYRFDEKTGHLLVLMGTSRVASNDEEVEEWLDCFPWAQYAPEASEAVSEADKGSSSDLGTLGEGPLASGRVF